MKILSQTTSEDGTICPIIYEDADSFDSLDTTKVTQTYGLCFFEEKLLIVLQGKNRTWWSFAGGTIEPDESYEDCLKREIQEETNMKVLKFKPLGYQAVQLKDKEIYQLRYVCTVEPYGEFISDPAGSVIEIKLIDPKDYKQYINWGAIGDRIVARALELKNEL